MTTRARASSTSSTKSSPANPNLIQPVPLHASRARGRPQPPPLTLSGPSSGATAAHRTRQQQQKTPPFQQQSGKPLPGMEDIEISGPLAFRDDHRTFRDRSAPEGGSGGHGTVGPGAARFLGNAAGGGVSGLHFQDGIVEQTFIRKGWVGEVPLESAREELW